MHLSILCCTLEIRLCRLGVLHHDLLYSIHLVLLFLYALPFPVDLCYRPALSHQTAPSEVPVNVPQLRVFPWLASPGWGPRKSTRLPIHP